MKRSHIAVLTALLLLNLTGMAKAADYTLKAASYVKMMSDGSPVTMWGYGVLSTDLTGDCATEPASYSSPGPALTADGAGLSIKLCNALPVDTSLVIPGQAIQAVPVVDGGGRVYSFTKVVAPGASDTYAWPAFGTGSYIYQSGTDPSAQVQMGLYGPATKDFAAGQAYAASVTNPSDYSGAPVMVFLSEIDPVFHQKMAAAPGIRTYTTVDYAPRYFLINGSSYTPGTAPLATVNIPVAGPVLLRFFSIGMNDHAPSLQGMHLDLIAEDGNLYPYPRKMYTVLLPAGKTIDARLTALPAEGYYAVYDRKLGLSGSTNKDEGMLAFLQVASAATPPVNLTVNIGAGTGIVRTVGSPGGVECSAPSCLTAFNQGVTVTLSAVADSGTPDNAFAGWSGCDTVSGNICTVTMSGARAVTASFGVAVALSIISPNGGEIVQTGTYSVYWNAPAVMKKFKLEFSPDNGTTWKLIAQNILTRTFLWNVQPMGSITTARIRVTGYDAAGVASGTAVSAAAFSIYNLISTPAAGTSFSAGAILPVTWFGHAFAKSYKLWYTVNDGKTWNYVTATAATNQSFVLPSVSSSSCRVMIAAYDGNGRLVARDISGRFSVAP